MVSTNAASRDNTARLWDANSGSLLYKLEDHNNEVTGVALSASGQYIATYGRTTHLWNASSGRQIRTFEGDSIVKNAMFSANGQRLATVSQNTCLWDVVTGAQLHCFQKHNRAKVWSPDGQRIATTSKTNTHIWNAEGNLLCSYQEHNEGIQSIAFSPDGHRIATASNKTVIVSLASPDAWLRHGCELLHDLDEYYDDQIAAICDPCLNEAKCIEPARE